VRTPIDREASVSTRYWNVATLSLVLGVLLLSAPWMSTASQSWDSFVTCHPDLPDQAAALQFATSFLRQEYGNDLSRFGALRVGTAAPWDSPAAASGHTLMDANYPDTWIVTNAVYDRRQWVASDGGIEIYVGKHAGCVVRTHVVG